MEAMLSRMTPDQVHERVSLGKGKTSEEKSELGEPYLGIQVAI
jgi:hypothetical protein